MSVLAGYRARVALVDRDAFVIVHEAVGADKRERCVAAVGIGVQVILPLGHVVRTRR